MYGVSDDIRVKAIEPNKRIQIEWSDGTEVEWTFEPRTDNHTFVTTLNSGSQEAGTTSSTKPLTPWEAIRWCSAG